MHNLTNVNAAILAEMQHLWDLQSNARPSGGVLALVEIRYKTNARKITCAAVANIDGKPEDFTMLFIKSSPAPDILDQAMLTPLIPDAEPTDIELAAMGIYPAEYISKLYN